MKISDVKGVIFDVDDTLLNNYPAHIPMGLHEHSRLQTAHAVGERHGIRGLQTFTMEQSFQAFRDAKIHSVHGAIWQMLIMTEQVKGEVQFDHPLLVEMVQLKDEIHEEVLRVHGREVPGATKFIQALVRAGLQNRLAVASSANPRDVNLFFDIADLHQYFPSERIITRVDVEHTKPHPETFEKAFKTLKLKSKKGVLAFEDDPRGVQSAKAAGLYVCAITTRFSREVFEATETPPDLICNSFAEFAAALGLPKLD